MENTNYDSAMEEIKKYRLPERIIVGKFESNRTEGKLLFRIPEACRILHVDVKDGKWCLWAEIDPVGEDMQTFVDVRLELIGTGDAVPEDGDWLKTYIEGPFVWHLYLTYMR